MIRAQCHQGGSCTPEAECSQVMTVVMEWSAVREQGAGVIRGHPVAAEYSRPAQCGQGLSVLRKEGFAREQGVVWAKNVVLAPVVVRQSESYHRASESPQTGVGEIEAPNLSCCCCCCLTVLETGYHSVSQAEVQRHDLGSPQP